MTDQERKDSEVAALDAFIRAVLAGRPNEQREWELWEQAKREAV